MGVGGEWRLNVGVFVCVSVCMHGNVGGILNTSICYIANSCSYCPCFFLTSKVT